MRRPQREKRKAARVTRLAIALAACTLALACGKKDIATPPPTPAVAVPAPAPPRVSSQPVSEPQIVATLPPEQPIPPEALPDVPPPLAVDPPRPAADLAGDENEDEVPGEPEEPAEPVEAATQNPALRLGRILSPEERNTFNASIDESLRAARRGVAAVLRRSPNPEQTEDIKRVRAIIRQAEATRQQDLPLSKNLAERAKLLAEDLARSVQ